MPQKMTADEIKKDALDKQRAYWNTKAYQLRQLKLLERDLDWYNSRYNTHLTISGLAEEMKSLETQVEKEQCNHDQAPDKKEDCGQTAYDLVTHIPEGHQ